MENLICRLLMLLGVLAGVSMAGGQGDQAVAPVVLALVIAALLRRIAPSLPWRFGHGKF